MYMYMCIYIYIYVKPPDEYPWQGRNSFNSGIFVILKKIVNLELQVTFIKQPVFAGPNLKWLLKSSLIVNHNFNPVSSIK